MSIQGAVKSLGGTVSLLKAASNITQSQEQATQAAQEAAKVASPEYQKEFQTKQLQSQLAALETKDDSHKNAYQAEAKAEMARQAQDVRKQLFQLNPSEETARAYFGSMNFKTLSERAAFSNQKAFEIVDTKNMNKEMSKQHIAKKFRGGKR